MKNNALNILRKQVRFILLYSICIFIQESDKQSSNEGQIKQTTTYQRDHKK